MLLDGASLSKIPELPFSIPARAAENSTKNLNSSPRPTVPEFGYSHCTEDFIAILARSKMQQDG